MKWSWKGPVALVGVAVLAYFVFIFVAGIVMIAAGRLGWFEGLLVMLSVGILLAVFVGSGFVAAKVEERIRRRKAKLDLGGDQMRTCASCGKQVPKGAHFCPCCGKKVEAKEPGPEEISLVQDEIYKCLIREAGSAVLVVVGLAAGGWGFLLNNTSLAVIGFMAAALGLALGPYYANKRQKLTQKRLKGR